jgi:hypothetical protein
VGIVTAAAVHLVPSTHTDPTSRTGATVTPHHRPSPPNLTARIVASLVLGLPSLAAIYGSAAALIHIAGEERLSDPRVLPFCLDILAIGIVVSAVFCGHDDHLSRWTPWLAYGASAALQVADVWADGPRAWAVHALPLAAAILGTEKILRLWRPAAVAPPAEVDAEPIEATPEPEPAPAKPAALVSVAPVVRPAPAPTVAKVNGSGDLDPVVLAKVRTALDEMNVTAADATRDAVLKHLRPGAPHATKVGAALNHLREQS